MSRHLRTEPIHDDDAAIARALASISVSALTAAAVHITGDPSFVRGPIRPREFVLNEFNGMLAEDEKAELRVRALDTIRAWRDAGCPPVAPLSTALVREVMDWIACEPVPDDYAALYLEEMDLAGRNPRALPVRATACDREELSVLVIGCGEAGLLAGIRLKEAGIPFEIIEKSGDVGGTWLDNTYPGARVDVATHYYSYSFEANDGFSEYYARQPELYRYFRRVFDEHGIAEHVRWHSEVERAAWDETASRWQVTIRGPQGLRETRSARVLISAVGLLSRPLIPDLPGLDGFEGPVFHTAEWDHSVDLRGKRVALIGAGASGFQVGPAIVDEVERLVVFQRTPQWMAPNPRYHAPVTPGERWAMRHLPGFARWYRFMLMWQSSDKLLELVRADETWPDFPRTANAASAARREVFSRWIEQHVGDDPVLKGQVTPDYPPMAKRMLQDNGSWLRCLRRPHVELVTDGITGIGPSSVTTAEGRFDVDVIVLATGFRASELLWPMEIVGRDSVPLSKVWDGKPAAYRGISVPGFPNFFMMAGPGTGIAHAGSVILTTECQMRYIGDAIRTLVDGDHRAIEPTQEAYDRYQQELQAEIATLMWGHPSIEHSWYKAADGKVYVLCPWRLVDYWTMTGRVVPDDHHVS
ncbi:NAD(P)/FAD-dependent oxidoreductase [Frankia sp. AgB1.9]|uniref:flavin-containing monooxygenase n=1 Tax=unclassified Frankia TaxID=2632575 RepID=UPI001932D398|nr:MULTISPECIES: NAD(P)/FAD-dependent oxidoreductase [unclassified Frankia]MBL7489675.1 NAD(P)/FAD-dependent oxidoreductase [Frankia sp. AgW1.1]MBL7550730.1 NAD(P)/FAD-dependent oxidoreductase [Frankia sp. AgB1.9]MBL7624347.1 NAD(P)/FAD-dependent oxidoreductase [Frankia sp. AgB1.8]